MVGCYKVNVRRAYRLVRCRRSTFYYQSKRPEQASLRKRIKEIASKKPKYGYRRITILVQREGLPVNAKRVYRIYNEEGLQMRQKVPKRRVSPQLRQVRVPAAKQNRSKPFLLTLPMFHCCQTQIGLAIP